MLSIAKCENDMLSLCGTIDVLIDAFCDPKTHIHRFKSMKTMMKSLHVLLGLSPVWKHYLKGSQ